MFNNFVTGNVATGLNVTQASSPNMTVLIQPGTGLIREGSNPGQISYHVINDTSGGESVTVSTANASNPRNDYAVGYIDKAVTPTGTNNTNVYKYAVVAGTPSATPADPTVGQIQTAIGAANPYHILGRIRVATSTTTITNAAIDDLRVMLQQRVETTTNPVNFAVYRNAAANPGNGSMALVQFDTKVRDTGNNVDITTNKGRVTVTVPCVLHVDAYVAITPGVGSGGDFYITCAIYKNGVLLYNGNSSTTRAGLATCSISENVKLAAGDYFELFAQGNNAGLTLDVGSAAKTRMSAYMVSGQ